MADKADATHTAPTGASCKVCATCGARFDATALFCPKDGTPLGNSRTVVADDPYVRLVIDGQIELRQLIGVGSMGRVYRAYQRAIDRDVAVKMLHRELSANAGLVKRFLSEARIASKLTHPHVVQVLMAGQLPVIAPSAPIGGELYIVMEYLDGISLGSSLAAVGGAMPLARAIRIVLEICDAVGAAHEQGIVHRDIKPENVMLIRSGEDTDFVKVLDFGIARLVDSKSEPLTEAGMVFGTAQYISPEGALGQVVTPAADVYAIATVLYQCLSGQTPFAAESTLSLLMKHAYEVPLELRSVARASYVPVPIADAIMRNLSKVASERANDARVFGKQLLQAAVQGGLCADDLLRRSTLLGHPSPHISLASVQRTKQMRLSKEAAQAIDSHALDSERVPESQPAAFSQQNDQQPHQNTSDERDRDSSDSLESPDAMAGDDVDVDSEDSLYRVLPKRRIRARVVVLTALVAAVCVIVAAAVARKFEDSPQSYVERANRALKSRHWDQPPESNVKEITQRGLARNPGNAALLEVRKRAAQELVTQALGRKYAGDLSGALHDVRLAIEFAPDSTTAHRLLKELELAEKKQQNGEPSASIAAPLPSAASVQSATQGHRSQAAPKASGEGAANTQVAKETAQTTQQTADSVNTPPEPDSSLDDLLQQIVSQNSAEKTPPSASSVSPSPAASATVPTPPASSAPASAPSPSASAPTSAPKVSAPSGSGWL